MSADVGEKTARLTLPLGNRENAVSLGDYGIKHESAGRVYFVMDGEGIIREGKVESSPKNRPEADPDVLEDLEKVL